MEIRKYFEKNTENTTNQNVHKAAKAVVKGKYIALRGLYSF